MSAFALALIGWLAGAGGAFLVRRSRLAGLVGAGGAVAGGAAGVVAAVRALTSPPASWQISWGAPLGSIALRLDPLAGVFLLPVAGLGALCAIYGAGYLRGQTHGISAGNSFAAYDLLLASMAIVVAAGDLVLLVIAWELMTLSSWALVVSEHEERTVRNAGLQYLIAGHLATAALLVLVVSLAAANGGFAVAPLAGRAPVGTGALFVLALIAFGTKAGMVPLHVWLPDAHPAAPSHVSALMSAVMVTMGIYGLSRFIPLLGVPSLWWADILLLLGAAGAVTGMVFAVAQRDVKRVLAYSTIEHTGIVTLALGVALLGTVLGRPALTGMAWLAALLHVWNHALAKAPLFLGFGAAAQAARSRSLDALGGLLRRWPLAGSALVLLGGAIASLPGLNVFVSEWLLLRALLAGIVSLRGAPAAAAVGAVAALAFAGGLAVACFARLVGLAFLGTARTRAADTAPPPARAIWVPIVTCATACVAVASAPHTVASLLTAAVRTVAPGVDVTPALRALHALVPILPLLAAASALAIAVQRWAHRRSPERAGPTWGCGYPSLTPTMQYTSTSFSEPLMHILQPVLHTETRGTFDPARDGPVVWPATATWATHTPDRTLAGVYQPLFAAAGRLAGRLRGLQQPRVTTSILSVALVALLLLGLLVLPLGGK